MSNNGIFRYFCGIASKASEYTLTNVEFCRLANFHGIASKASVATLAPKFDFILGKFPNPFLTENPNKSV